MRKIFFIFILGGSMLISSCSKQLTQIPYNALPPTIVFNNDNDFKNAVNGMYYEMMSEGTYYDGGDVFSFVADNDILSDNLICYSGSRGTGQTFSFWTYNSLNTTTFYAGGFEIINAANQIISNINKLPSDDENRNDFLGQALAVRAIVHFDMVRLFGKGYSQASDQDLGIPYISTVQSYKDPSPVRATVKSNYDSIEADLKAAASIINNNSSSVANGQLSKAAVYGYLSRLYLNEGKWQDCIDAATSALAINADPGSLTDFPDIWTDATNNGVLFKLRMLVSDKYNNVGTVFGQTTKAEVMPTMEFYNLYKDNDIRKSSYFQYVNNNNTNILLIIKYLGRPGSTANLNDVKLMRVAEVLLNRAEAYANLGGNDSKALSDLNKLREDRYTDYADGSETGQSLKDAIALQRRLELAMEGDRFVDLKRRGLPIVRPTNNGGWPTALVRPFPDKALTMDASSYLFQLPIDQGSITASNGKIVQNPGAY